MAHKTGAAFSGGHIIHGAANAMYLPKVIKYNAKNPEAAERYAEIARFIDLKGSTTEELVDALIAELREMNKQLNIPLSIQNYGEDVYKRQDWAAPYTAFWRPLKWSRRRRPPRHCAVAEDPCQYHAFARQRLPFFCFSPTAAANTGVSSPSCSSPSLLKIRRISGY